MSDDIYRSLLAVWLDTCLLMASGGFESMRLSELHARLWSESDLQPEFDHKTATELDIISFDKVSCSVL